MRALGLIAALFLAWAATAAALAATAGELRGTGDLGIIIERADGAVVVVDTTTRTMLGRIEGLGDLSHASAVFSRDQRYAYVFGRDGGLTKLDLLDLGIARRVVQSGNSIGGAISDDGTLVAVSCGSGLFSVDPAAARSIANWLRSAAPQEIP